MDIKILHESVSCSEDYKDIDILKFLKDNPRVYAVTHGKPGFDQRPEEEQQEIIFEKLQDETSVRNLVPEIERHGGLIEPVLVRLDTMEVIEGNSRLAAYRVLRNESRGVEDWSMIPCYLISKLTDDQQAAFLNQIHVKGKTQWSAYEKANFAYVRKVNGWSVDRIAKLFGESGPTIYTRINAIRMMKDSGDPDYNHFSFYDVLVRNRKVSGKMEESSDLRERLFKEIRESGSGDVQTLTAQDLRNGLRDIIKKPKILARYASGDIDFGEARDRAEISAAEQRVRRAVSLVEEISFADVEGLPQNARNSLIQVVRKLDRALGRIRDMVGREEGR